METLVKLQRFLISQKETAESWLQKYKAPNEKEQLSFNENQNSKINQMDEFIKCVDSILKKNDLYKKISNNIDRVSMGGLSPWDGGLQFLSSDLSFDNVRCVPPQILPKYLTENDEFQVNGFISKKDFDIYIAKMIIGKERIKPTLYHIAYKGKHYIGKLYSYESDNRELTDKFIMIEGRTPAESVVIKNLKYSITLEENIVSL